jgi:hypothetical protein
MGKSITDIANSWINYQIQHEENGNPGYEHPDWYALEQLWEYIEINQDKALATMDKIVEASDKDYVLGAMGAGPLEDLLCTETSSRYVQGIIDRANRNKKWELAFGCVWTSRFQDRKVAARVEQAIHELFPSGRP